MKTEISADGFVLPRAMVMWTNWVFSDDARDEMRRFEAFYGRALTARESMMCLPYDVLLDIAHNSNGAIDCLDVFLLKLAHANESSRRLDCLLQQHRDTTNH